LIGNKSSPKNKWSYFVGWASSPSISTRVVGDGHVNQGGQGCPPHKSQE
jgi:hypothetical protein